MGEQPFRDRIRQEHPRRRSRPLRPALVHPGRRDRPLRPRHPGHGLRALGAPGRDRVRAGLRDAQRRVAGGQGGRGHAHGLPGPPATALHGPARPWCRAWAASLWRSWPRATTWCSTVPRTRSGPWSRTWPPCPGWTSRVPSPRPRPTIRTRTSCPGISRPGSASPRTRSRARPTAPSSPTGPGGWARTPCAPARSRRAAARWAAVSRGIAWPCTGGPCWSWKGTLFVDLD